MLACVRHVVLLSNRGEDYDYNTDRGKQEIDRLKELVARLSELSATASSNAAALARPLADIWKPANDALELFRVEVGLIQTQVGEQDYDLDDMNSLYANLNSAMATSYKDIVSFGGRSRVICDDWG